MGRPEIGNTLDTNINNAANNTYFSVLPKHIYFFIGGLEITRLLSYFFKITTSYRCQEHKNKFSTYRILCAIKTK